MNHGLLSLFKNQFIEFLVFQNYSIFEPEEVLLKLNVLNEAGQTKKFQKELLEILEASIIEKKYPLFNLIFNHFSEFLYDKNSRLILELLYKIEVLDRESLQIYSNNIINNFYHNNISIGLIERVYIFLEQVKIDEHRLYKKKLHLYLILCVKGSYIATNRKLIDFMLLADSLDEFLIIHELIRDHALKEMLELYIRDKFKIKNLKGVPFFTNFSLIKPNKNIVKIEKAKVDTKPIHENFENEKIIERSLIFQKFDKSIEKYMRSPEESELIKKFNSEDIPPSTDLIVSFIMLKYFDLALLMNDKLESKEQSNYLKVAILLGKGEYSNVVYEANNIINSLDVNKVDEVIAFEILKYKALKELGDNELALKCRLRIKTLNPDYLII